MVHFDLLRGGAHNAARAAMTDGAGRRWKRPDVRERPDDGSMVQHSPWYGTVPSLRHRRGRAGRGGRAGAHNVRSNDDDDHYVASEVAVGHFYSDRLEAMFRVRSNQHKM